MNYTKLAFGYLHASVLTLPSSIFHYLLTGWHVGDVKDFNCTDFVFSTIVLAIGLDVHEGVLKMTVVYNKKS